MTQKIILATAAVVALVAFQSPAWSKSDKDFIEDAIKGDNSEVTLGDLAAQKGSSAKIRSFGQILAKDHAKAKIDAVKVAKSLGVAPPESMQEEAQRELTKLKTLSGDAFDKEFASYMVDDHKKDIAEFKEKANAGKSETSVLAKKTLPALEKHLKMAESLSTIS